MVGDRQGSGLIVHSNGLVLTSATLVGKLSLLVGKLTTATVTLDDKRSFRATVLGLDEYRNLAVLEIGATGLPAAKMGDSTKLTPGQSIAVVGYDSGAGRPVAHLGTVQRFRNSATTGMEYIETDALAAAGAQGGPVVNLQGEVMGLFVPSPSSFPTSGVIHAVTTQSMASYLDKLKRGAKVFRPTPASSLPPCTGSGFPPVPDTYSGSVTVDGKAAADGALVIAAVNDYVSSPATVSGGTYKDLHVIPPCGTYIGAKITFYVDGFAAAESRTFKGGYPGVTDPPTVSLTVTMPPAP